MSASACTRSMPGWFGLQYWTAMAWPTLPPSLKLQAYRGTEICIIVIMPHCHTTYTDVAYCYRQSNVVCLSQSWACKNGWTDRDTIWILDLGGPKEPRIRWGPDPQYEGAVLGVTKGVSIMTNQAQSEYKHSLTFHIQALLSQQWNPCTHCKSDQ